MQRRHARWGIRMGLDERMFLEDGWSEPRDESGVIARRIVSGSAGLVIPLHGPRPYRFGLRVRSDGPSQRLRVLFNDRFLGAGDAAPGGCLEVACRPRLRPGRTSCGFASPARPWDSG
jgi:hypothetical protein